MVSTTKVSLWFSYLVVSMFLVFSTLPEISPGKGICMMVGGGAAYGFMKYLLQWVQSRFVAQKG